MSGRTHSAQVLWCGAAVVIAHLIFTRSHNYGGGGAQTVKEHMLCIREPLLKSSQANTEKYWTRLVQQSDAMWRHYKMCGGMCVGGVWVWQSTWFSTSPVFTFITQQWGIIPQRKKISLSGTCSMCVSMCVKHLSKREGRSLCVRSVSRSVEDSVFGLSDRVLQKSTSLAFKCEMEVGAYSWRLGLQDFCCFSIAQAQL